jgi:hypothetical protein
MRASSSRRSGGPLARGAEASAILARLRAVRLAVVLAAALLLAGAAIALPAFADPPGRVGRLSAIEGEATVQVPEGETFAAEVNLPVTSGLVLVTAPGARAEVRIGSIVARIDGDSTLRFPRIDDTMVALALDRGTLALRLRARDTVGEVVVQTPEGQLGFGDVGRYRIDVGGTPGDVGGTPGATFVSVERGFARLVTADFAIDVRGGRALVVEAGAARFVAPLPDAFDTWTQARDRRDDALAQGNVSSEMTGYEDLAAYGDWRTTAAYGAVWVPRAVPAGWSPYGYGRWRWIAPWGWTWIDAAPWGFAPFHYGRWCWLDGAWGWSPGVWVPRPVYAPALVGWIGRPGWSIAYRGVPAAGWVPLAPREPFVPWYRASPVHLQKLNITQVDIHVYKGPPPAVPAVMDGAPTPGHASDGSIAAFANARVPNAVMVAPATALGGSHRIGGSPLAVSTTQLAAAQPIEPIAPLPGAAPRTGPRSAWGGVSYASPPPLARPGAGLPIASPAMPGGALTGYGQPYVRPPALPPPMPSMPPAPRFANTPSGFAGATPRIAPPTIVSTIPARPMFVPPAMPVAPPRPAAIGSYAPSIWPHPVAPLRTAPPPAGIASGIGVPHPVFGGGLPARPASAPGFHGPSGGVRGGHR